MITATTQSKTSRVGWGLLIALSALLILNGMAWYLVIVDTQMGRNASILLTGLGVLALLVALEGYRGGSRWAWRTMWVVVAVLVAIAVQVLTGGEEPTRSLLSWFQAAIAVVGLLLARKGLVS